MAFSSGCDDHLTSSDAEQANNQPLVIKELVPPMDLEGSKVTDFDSLREVLTSIILPIPAHRTIENWYGKRGEWVPRLGSSENLQIYIDHIYEEWVRDGKMKMAAAAKLARGRIYFVNAQYPDAVTQLQEVLDIGNDIRDSSSVGWAYLTLSSSLLQLDDLEKSEEYIDRAAAIAFESRNEDLEISTLLTKPGLYMPMGRMENAESIYKEVIRRSRERQLIEVEKIAFLNLAYYNIITKDYDQAISLLTENPIFTESDVSLVTAVHSLDLYEAYVGKKDYKRAYEYLLEGSRQSDELDYAYGKRFSKISLSEHYERQGMHDLALDAYKEYHKLNEEQAGQEARLELQTLRAKQDFQEKDWEIERLIRAEQKTALQYRIRRNVLLATIFGLVVIFSFLYMLLKSKTSVNRANQNKEIAETRLQVLQSQINPHFIFNAITGIQNSILKSKTIDAYNYLGKFSAILRVMATTATSISISLDQEVELINNYLALEKLRFRDGFVYSVGVSEDLVNMHYQVPGMLVQPIVENAIIHGVSNLPYQGKIDVFFQNSGDGVKIIVSDNGRGRKEASVIAQKEADKHLSIASKNASDTLKALHSMGYQEANITTLDLFKENGDPAGTQVTIYLPFFQISKSRI